MCDLEIIVPTRNRPDVLSRSLKLMRAHFPGVPILVHDDASNDEGAVAAAVAAVKPSRLIRSNKVVGPSGGRRRLLAAAQARWCLALDDDCYPREDFDPSGWVAKEPGAADPIIIAFRYFHPRDGRIAPKGPVQAGPSRHFIGGASLLHRESVLAIGSYCERLIFGAEDTELAMRVWASGAQVWCDPDSYIIHDHVAVGRDLRYEAFYYVRNRIVINVLTLPFWYGFPYGLGQAVKRCMSQPNKLWGLAGIISGVVESIRCLPDRRPLTFAMLRWLKTLPS